MTFIRVSLAFVLSLLTATTVTALLIAFPLWLFPPIGMLALLYSLSAITCAALFLGPAFIFAGLFSPHRASTMVAGGIAGFLFVLASLLVSRVHILPLWVGHRELEHTLRMLGPHPSLELTMAFGVAATVAGLCAGLVFGRISAPTASFWGSSGWRNYSLLAVPVLSVPVLFVAWMIVHDPAADRLCAHGSAVRASIGNTVYRIPAAYEPDILFANQSAGNEVRIFRPEEWPDSPAARQSHFHPTYCQTAAMHPGAFVPFPSSRCMPSRCRTRSSR